MSFWIELMCDVRKSEVTPAGEPGCLTDINENVMGMARSASDTVRVLAILKRDALRQGWRFENRKWICPRCATLPKRREG